MNRNARYSAIHHFCWTSLSVVMDTEGGICEKIHTLEKAILPQCNIQNNIMQVKSRHKKNVNIFTAVSQMPLAFTNGYSFLSPNTGRRTDGQWVHAGQYRLVKKVVWHGIC